MTDQGKNFDYDLIVIGSGAVGENVADYARKRGVSVAIVESELVGGECSYWACMPSKALLRSGHAIRAARRLAGTRDAITGTIDASAVLARRTAFTDHWQDDGQVSWLDSAGIELIRGHGRIAGPGRVQVAGRTYSARAVAVATGSIPFCLRSPGWRMPVRGARGKRHRPTASRLVSSSSEAESRALSSPSRSPRSARE